MLAHYDKAGKDESLLLSQIIGDKNAADILNYPQKTYADQICINDNTYNYAISARQDKPGLVICYTDITRFQNDKNELSLSTMLDAEMFRQDVTVVITDGMRVISTNCEQLENMLVQYYPIADVLVGGEQLTPDTLLQLKNDSGTWYGMFTQYRDYYLYAFFPSRVVYASRRGWMLLFTAIYLFCGMGYLIWRQYSKKRRLLRMEKEYHLVSAISSIYLSNLLIHPQDDTWEPVVQSERMKAITNGVLSAKAMLEKFNTECVAEAYREEFRAFTDLDTAQQRLEGKAFDGFTMENVEGKWYQLLLVPQRRFTRREKPSSLMLLFRDVSEQKERDMEYQENLRRAAEEATLANAAKTDFLRRMSHDIRTPINGIHGMVQIADRFPNDAKKQAECRAKIMRSSDFLLDLVNDVLDMSKLESGEMQLEEVYFVLSKHINVNGRTCTLEIASHEDEAECARCGGDNDAPTRSSFMNFYRDTLTGTYTRLYLESFQSNLESADAVVIVDVDLFKQINDTYSHPVGDEALKTIANTIHSGIRGSDTLIRYGGDEFLIIFSKIGEEVFYARLKQLRRAVQKTKLPDYPEVKLDVSLGGVYRVHPLSEAIRQADLRMYENKAEHANVYHAACR